MNNEIMNKVLLFVKNDLGLDEAEWTEVMKEHKLIMKDFKNGHDVVITLRNLRLDIKVYRNRNTTVHGSFGGRILTHKAHIDKCDASTIYDILREKFLRLTMSLI